MERACNISRLFLYIFLCITHCFPDQAIAGYGNMPRRDFFGGYELQNNGSAAENVLLWPLPASVSYGNGIAHLPPDFEFVPDLPADDGADTVASHTLKEAFNRYRNLIFRLHSTQGGSHASGSDVRTLTQLLVSVDSPNEELQLGIDESYELIVPDNEGSTSSTLKAKTIYGALHGLETFSQLLSFNFKTRNIELKKIPWKISDEPQFKYRGLLVDTSRHYEPLQVLKSVIDSMSYAKLNVLHWHIVDIESFPIEIPSYPKLWNGAYSEQERYTIEDAKELVEYARLRGINVMAELDVPGHARSWGVGYPDLWPSLNCTQPLDISKEFTFKVIDGIISDFAKVFPFKLMHLGGDEVDTSCWKDVPHVQAWLTANNLTTFGAYEDFVLRAQKIALSRGYQPVNWEETFDNFGSSLSPNTVVHEWLGPGATSKAVKAGYQSIVSNQDAWYLDHLDVPWTTFYNNDPLAGITDVEQQKLVLGGEVCMWGETADASDIKQTIWPRAAAAAETLWSPADVREQGVASALHRLEVFRCLLNQRGIEAAPVHVLGRQPPPGYGSCYEQ